MTTPAGTRLTPTQRLTRGVARTAAGPVDVVRGTAGLLGQSVAATFSGLHAQYRKSQARKELRKELAAAQELVEREFADVREAVKDLPHALAQARAGGAHESHRKRLVLVGVGVGVVTLAGGAVVFARIRRSQQAEPSTLPPSVDITPSP